MQSFLLAKSHLKDWDLALEQCIAQLGTIPAEATLGFIYVTDGYANDLGEILRQLKQHTQLENWVGTVGMAICCTRTEYYDQPAMVMLLTDLPTEHFQLFGSAENLPSVHNSDKLHVAIVHGDPRNGQIANLISNLPEQISNGYLIGGLTSSNSYHYQISHDLHEGALSGVILDETIPVITGLTQGCSPLGAIHQVTKSDSNIVVTLDDQPALDVMKQDIGEVLARDLNRIGGYIFAGFPVVDSDTGDYLVRNLMGIDTTTGAIAVAEYIQPDSQLMFCKRDGSTAIEDMQRMVTKLKQRAHGKIKGGLYFSCLGRGEHLFGEPHKEMELIADILGDIPIVGFYANGEIAGNRLYGYTGVLTLFLAE